MRVPMSCRLRPSKYNKAQSKKTQASSHKRLSKLCVGFHLTGLAWHKGKRLAAQQSTTVDLREIVFPPLLSCIVWLSRVGDGETKRKKGRKNIQRTTTVLMRSKRNKEGKKPKEKKKKRNDDVFVSFVCYSFMSVCLCVLSGVIRCQTRQTSGRGEHKTRSRTAPQAGIDDICCGRNRQEERTKKELIIFLVFLLFILSYVGVNKSISSLPSCVRGASPRFPCITIWLLSSQRLRCEAETALITAICLCSQLVPWLSRWLLLLLLLMLLLLPITESCDTGNMSTRRKRKRRRAREGGGDDDEGRGGELTTSAMATVLIGR
eukprot:m.80753 g.80753  ORF g.80753 m.80753 type:complete len:320 (-) comp14222_c0_seq1:432-1391(-)